jgi:thiol-disulfide isomerase/thioredoxin
MTNDMPAPPPVRPPGTRRPALTVAVVLIGAAIGFAATYGSGLFGTRPSSGDPTCRGAVALAGKIAPLIRGEVAALTAATAPLKLPDLAFEDGSGAPKKLSDFRGKTVLLNLWATWCVPCVAEMPALDRLAQRVTPGIAVVALSSDRGGAAAVERFYRERQIAHLPVALDPGGAGARALGARGIPTTLIIGADGRERARLEGAADWGSPAAIAAIRRLVG